MAKFSKLDLVPKRKNMNEILQDLERIKKERAAYQPVNRGQDRQKKIGVLQEKNQFATKNKGPDLTEEEEAKIAMAVQAQMRRIANKNYFGNHGMIYEEEKVEKHQEFDNTALNELNEIFDQIVVEIEERQKYLLDIGSLDMPEAKEKVKQEIVERVSELEKVNKMIKEERSKSKKI